MFFVTLIPKLLLSTILPSKISLKALDISCGPVLTVPSIVLTLEIILIEEPGLASSRWFSTRILRF